MRLTPSTGLFFLTVLLGTPAVPNKRRSKAIGKLLSDYQKTTKFYQSNHLFDLSSLGSLGPS
jgi:hypothetical protein